MAEPQPLGITLDGTPAAADDQFRTFRYRLAPEGLATRRQLSALGLRPGGAEPVAMLSWRNGLRIAYLYRISSSVPKRPMTPKKWESVRNATNARKICPVCKVQAEYVIPTSLGKCLDCEDQR